MTITLDVIAACVAPEPEVIPEPAPEPEPTLAEPSGVFVIHTAPSPKLDPSAKDLEKVTIVED